MCIRDSQDTLQKKITESFQTVSQQLEQVYKGLGEMQHLEADVGGLKQVQMGIRDRITGILLVAGLIIDRITATKSADE